MLAYPLAMAVALAYFAEHYIVDAIAGWLLVGASFWLWNRIEVWLATRSVPIDDVMLGDDEADKTRDSLVSADATTA
ncbi:MAG: phosphatase PAP2 family protein, partial [Ilumatobacter sp.]|nr:phosphatase PAP2 family protein [Ilumatobacter sp.]